jgi:hypothetical protein
MTNAPDVTKELPVLQDSSENRTYSPLPLREIVIHHRNDVVVVEDATTKSEEPKEDAHDEAYILKVIMECFGLCTATNEPGAFACLRHPHCRIATGLLVTTAANATAPFRLLACCRCVEEEEATMPTSESPPPPSSSNWTLFQLLHFLQNSSNRHDDDDLNIRALFQTNPPVSIVTPNDTLTTVTEPFARILSAFHSEITMAAALQRLHQVHHWKLLAQLAQMQQYQQLLFSLQQQNLQHQATIKQLRRTIQQDCKFIKTMATQQQDVEQALGLSNHGCSEGPGSSPNVITRTRSSISQSMHNAASAHVIHESLGEEEETTETTAGDDFLLSPPVTETNTPNPSLLPSWNPPLQRRSLKSSSEIFRSFRGGLLDPPSSPPVPVQGNHNKLTLDSDARHALQIPSRGLLSRSNSVAGDSVVPLEVPTTNHSALRLPNAPFSPLAAAESLATPGKEDEAEDAATVFHVTGATSRDKFGDEGVYTGPILVTEGLPHGPHGRMEYLDSGRIYDGDWVSGQWHGRGRLLNPNGDSYEGDFCFDARHGHGIYRWDNGDVYVGNFTSDKRHGKGKFCFNNGNVYEGEFLDGLFDGYGKYVFAGGSYEGNWKDGRYNGTGVLTYSSTGGKYTGEFRNSVAHGFGIEILPDGRQRRGMWVDGKPTEYSDDAKQPQFVEEDPK